MSQNIEIEFKNMLLKEEYDRLISQFKIRDSDIFTQENHYFDTAEFALKEAGAALRIRQKGSHYEMTLKQSLERGLLETNQSLSKEEATAAFSCGKLPGGEIENLINKLGISFTALTYFGSLTTKRAEFPFKKGLLVLDHSYYLNKEDYEIEYEVENYESGQEIFLAFLMENKIPQRKTANKIQRFYLQKQTWMQ